MRHSRARAFTLLEVLAALALAAVGFFITMSAIGQASRLLIQDQLMTQMALTAQSLLDERTRGVLTAGTYQGIEGDIQWTLLVKLASATLVGELYSIDLQLVSHGQQQHFTSLRLQGRAPGLTP